MAQITRLQSALLAKALGLREMSIGEISDVVVPVLNLEPYLDSQVAPGAVSTTYPIYFGFEATNLLTGQGVNVDARVAADILVHSIHGVYSMGILAAPAAAALMQFLGYFYIFRQATPTMSAGNDSQLVNQYGRDSAFDAPTVRTNVGPPPTVNDGAFVATKFANRNAKTWVQTNGTGGAIHESFAVPELNMILRAGDFIGAHVDITGPAGSLPTEVQATLLVSRI